MTLEQQIKNGSEKLISLSCKTSKHDAPLAIAQLLLSAAALAEISGMTAEDFRHGVKLAMSETYGSERPTYYTVDDQKRANRKG